MDTKTVTAARAALEPRDSCRKSTIFSAPEASPPVLCRWALEGDFLRKDSGQREDSRSAPPATRNRHQLCGILEQPCPHSKPKGHLHLSNLPGIQVTQLLHFIIKIQTQDGDTMGGFHFLNIFCSLKFLHYSINCGLFVFFFNNRKNIILN
jgi:hypothetical protein